MNRSAHPEVDDAGRARHSVRAEDSVSTSRRVRNGAPDTVQSGERRARSGAPYHWNKATAKLAVIGAVLLGTFFLLQSRIPLRTAVQIGADEGFEVAKATLCLHGHKLYSEVWNDQPPLHTWLITRIVKLQRNKPLTPALSPSDGERVSPDLASLSSSDAERVSAGRVRGTADTRDALSNVDRQDALSHYSILWPRLLSSAFTALMIACVFIISWRVSGLLAGTLATALLIASPGFLELSSSCMLEIPALATALAGLCALLVLPRTKWYAAECLAGILFGIAALMKLVPLYLLPLAAMIVWLRQQLFTSLSRSDVGQPINQSGVSPVPHQPPHSKTSRRFGQAMQTAPRGRGGRFVSFALFVGLKSLRRLFVPMLVIGATLAASFALVDWFIERGAFLVHFKQSWSSHFGGVQSFEFGSPKEHAFEWSILPKNWDVTVPAILGICVLMSRALQQKKPLTPSLSPSDGERERPKPHAMLLPLTWLALALVVFTNHKPWWSYYYIHIAIPLCWCAALGIQSLCSALTRRLKERGSQRKQARRAILLRQAGSAIPLVLFALCAAAWMGTRVYLQISGVRNAPQLYTALVLKEIERLKPFTKWMYTDQIVYSFHADIPMPPPLAVVPLKRLWTGDMTRARIAAEMSRFKPEIILLGHEAREVPFQHLLDTDYRLIYHDERQRLYAERATIKRADAAESSAVRTR